jgi:hypothetical protein
MSRHIAEEHHRHPHEFVGDLLLGLNDGIAPTLVFAISVALTIGSPSDRASPTDNFWRRARW